MINQNAKSVLYFLALLFATFELGLIHGHIGCLTRLSSLIASCLREAIIGGHSLVTPVNCDLLATNRVYYYP